MAVLITAFTMFLDFSRFFGLYSLYELYPVHILKRICVVLAAAIVCLAGGDSFDKRGYRLLQYAFAAICTGEALFLLDKLELGILAFGICQTTLIIRHGKSLKAKLSEASSAQRARLLILSALIISALLLALILAKSESTQPSLKYTAMLYWFILNLSLWTGLANYILGLFPKTNSKLVAVGMLCFYACDILVGLDAVLTIGTPWMFANSFIWVFYTPALFLLALSCYKLQRLKPA